MREWIVDLILGAWYLITVITVGGAVYVWVQRNRAISKAFYAGVAEGKAIARLQNVLSAGSERGEGVWDGGTG